jgi:hypothetical protein
MSDLHQFNPGKKSWKMYTKELTSISGDDLTITPYDGQNLILEVSGNKEIIFKKGDVSYNLADLSNNASSSVNLTNYDDASFNNVDISGNLKISNGNIDISDGIINFFASDEQLLGPDSGIIQKVQDLSNNLLTSNNDASFNNIDICGNLNINGGSIQINGDAGTTGQVLTSNGSGSLPSWADPSNSFNQLYLGVTGTNQGIVNFKDLTDNGYDTIAQIKGLKDGTNGGKLQLFTKADGGSLTEKLKINDDGVTTDRVNLGAWKIASESTTAVVSGNFDGLVFTRIQGGNPYRIRFVLDNRMNVMFDQGFRLISDSHDVSIDTNLGGTSQIIYLNCSQVRSTGQFVFTSDDNLKSYEEPIVSATEILMKLNPKKYKKHVDLYTNEESPDLSGVNWHYEAGFVAQEVENIPELSYLVSEQEVKIMGTEHNAKSLSYNDLIAYLVKGFQEQKAEIDLLKERLETLETHQNNY